MFYQFFYLLIIIYLTGFKLGREFFVKRSLIPPSKLVLGIEFLNVPFTENYVMWNDNNCAPPELLVYSWGTVVNNPRMRCFVPGSRRNPLRK